MAAAPLLDLSTIDLEQRIFGPEELRASLAQRGTFEMLNGIIHRDVEAGLIVGYKVIRADDWWAADHIPGRPLFPGVLMIEAAAQLCSFDFDQRNPMGDAFVGFAGVGKTRFRGTVEPEGSLYFVGKLERLRSSMFTYAAQGFYAGKLVLETEVTGTVI